MDLSTVVNIIGVVAIPILGYVLTRLSTIQKELSDHKLYVADMYAKKEDLNTALDKIEKSIERLLEKLDKLIERRHLNREGDEL